LADGLECKAGGDVMGRVESGDVDLREGRSVGWERFFASKREYCSFCGLLSFLVVEEWNHELGGKLTGSSQS